jgi:hypothetical protein
MKVDITFFSFRMFSLGIFTAEGEDELGQFNSLTLGFLLFSIDIYVY